MYTIKLNKQSRNLTLKKVHRNLKLTQTGRVGPQGFGVPSGGRTNDILTKNTGADYDTGWNVNLTISDTAPASPNINDLWLDLS